MAVTLSGRLLSCSFFPRTSHSGCPFFVNRPRTLGEVVPLHQAINRSLIGAASE